MTTAPTSESRSLEIKLTCDACEIARWSQDVPAGWFDTFELVESFVQELRCPACGTKAVGNLQRHIYLDDPERIRLEIGGGISEPLQIKMPELTHPASAHDEG